MIALKLWNVQYYARIFTTLFNYIADTVKISPPSRIQIKVLFPACNITPGHHIWVAFLEVPCSSTYRTSAGMAPFQRATPAKGHKYPAVTDCVWENEALINVFTAQVSLGWQFGSTSLGAHRRYADEEPRPDSSRITPLLKSPLT